MNTRLFTNKILTNLLGVILLFQTPSVFSADPGHIGTNQKVLVACVKWDNYPTTRLNSCTDWATLLQNEISTFYDQATFGLTTFQFETPASAPDNGWFSLGYEPSEYEFFKTGQDAVDLIDPYVDFNNYNRLTVITNHPDFGGQGLWSVWLATDEGTEATFVEDGNSVDKRLMSMSIVNEWISNYLPLPYDTGAAVVAHELGHHLHVKTHYATVIWFPELIRDAITPWDVMGLSPHKNHFLAWAKSEREWIPAAAVQIIGPPSTADIDTTITLNPVETSGGTQLIEIPIATGPNFVGYTVENRQQTNGDENLPSSGVLISFVDENPNTALKEIVFEDPGSPGDLNQAPLEVGDAFNDTGRNLTITYVSKSGNNTDVRIEYRLPPVLPPNPQITPWGSPPWETVDIWIDSEKNGWNNYKYTDGSGNPVGNGDDAWVDHANKVYFRITNGGDGDATNVRVEVFANSPPGMGDRGADWAYLGDAVLSSIPAHTSDVGYVFWTPTVGEHTCIKVVIIDTGNEETTLDNVAQENVTAFDTHASSRYRAQCLKFSVNNPFKDRETPVHFLMRDIPSDWKIQIEPQKLILPPGGTDKVCVVVFPSEASDEYSPGYIGKLKLESLIPYANTFIPIGGIDIWTHLTTESTLSCDTDDDTRINTGGDAPQSSDGMGSGLAPPLTSSPSSTPTITPDNVEKLFLQGAIVSKEPQPVSVAIGESIVASGHLHPGFSGATIAVDFISRDKRVTQLVTTDPSGAWTATYNPDTGGIWEIQAFYAGDSSHASADSNRCRFDVQREKEKVPECDVDPRTARIAHWFVLALGAIALGLFITAYRKKVCWPALYAALIVALLALLALFCCLSVHIVYSGILFLIALAILYWWYWLCKKRDIE